MAQKPLDMNQIKQVWQLHNDGVGIKAIARRTGISRKTVKKYLRNLAIVNTPSEKEHSVTKEQMAGVAYNDDTTPRRGLRLEALHKHFKYAEGELYKTGVTRQLLWLEYCQQHQDGYRYSQYCYLLTKYLKDTDPAFHWEYTPGEFIQVDFAGKKLSYVDRQTGEVTSCEVFVAVLPFSGLLFCTAAHSQKTADVAGCINACLKYYGGVSKTILCDNMRTAVTKSDRYEPVFTELCHQLSTHYNTTFSATRPAAPTDKGMVEKAVNIVYTHVYAPMRHQVFHSLESLNAGIRLLLDGLNTKPYKNSSDSRRDIFERLEKATLKQLPCSPFGVKKGKQLTVQQNYAIQLTDNGHYYTVPYQYVGYKVWVSYDSRLVEVFYNQQRIALHVRNSHEPRFNRTLEHMPPHHQHMVEQQGWTVEELLARAARIGEYTRQAADRILHSSIYPEQNFKACHAMMLLQNQYSGERLEAACRRAVSVCRPTLSLIRNILKAGLDDQPVLFEEPAPLPGHQNIRGRENYK